MQEPKFITEPELRNSKLSACSTSESSDADFLLNDLETLEPEGFDELPFPTKCERCCEFLQSKSHKINVFKNISEQKALTYHNMNLNLKRVLEVIEEEIENVDVKDQCCLKPSPVQLDTPAKSLIKRRRTLEFTN